MKPLGLALAAHQKIKRLSDRFVKENRSPICQRGCDFCCHQPVGTLVVEGLAIAWFHHQDGIDEKAPELGRVRGKACPYLADGECSIYPVRPISCSTFFPHRSSKACTATGRVADNREPVIAARHLDDQFCKRIRLPWPGPLALPKAVEIGYAILAGGVGAAAALITPEDQLFLTVNPDAWEKPGASQKG